MSDINSTRDISMDEAFIKRLPTPLLHALYTCAHKELSKRRAADSVSRNVAKESDAFKRLSTEKFSYNKHRLKELDALMAQDWGHLFQEGDAERKYYVYSHVYPGMKDKDFRIDGEFKLSMPGLPFYIGKGCGARAWDMKRNEGHGVELRQLLARGHTPEQIVCVVRDGLTEREALEIESKLIYFFGTKFERDRKGLLVNLDVPKRPF